MEAAARKGPDDLCLLPRSSSSQHLARCQFTAKLAWRIGLFAAVFPAAADLPRDCLCVLPIERFTLDPMAEDTQRELEDLRRQLKDEQRLREAAERQRDKAETETRRTTLAEFLELCHGLSTSISVVADASSSTRGDVTDPTERLCPRIICPSSDDWHLETWSKIPDQCSFTAALQFPTRQIFEHVREHLPQVSSEPSLQRFHGQAVDDMVKDMIARAAEDAEMRDALQLRYTVDTQDHSNIGEEGNAQLSANMQNLRLTRNEKRRAKDRSPFRHKGTPDQYYIATYDDDKSRRAMMIMFRGLAESIDVFTDVVNNIEEPEEEDEHDRWWCRRLMTAVVVQLYSQMVHKRIRRGCVITGDAYVYVRLDDDPSVAKVKVHIPKLDYDQTDPFRLHNTAVARMFAFVVEAASLPPPSQSWSTSALSPWKQGSVREILQQMPESVKSNTNDSTYRPARIKRFVRSPIKTRSCRPVATIARSDTQSSESDGDHDVPESPSVTRTLRQKQSSRQEPRERGRAGSTGGNGAASSAGQRRHDSLQPMSQDESKGIQKASYCSHACLKRLIAGTDVDVHCPNQSFHPGAVPKLQEFLTLVKHQLRIDTGPDADCMELSRSGAHGTLFKIRLRCHGYTFVAKAVRALDSTTLSEELKRYDHIRHMQGDVVPLDAEMNAPYRHLFPALGHAALSKLHSCGVLHGDMALRNILFDADTRKLMFIDFERRDKEVQDKRLTFQEDLGLRRLVPSPSAVSALRSDPSRWLASEVPAKIKVARASEQGLRRSLHWFL
ncbi:hypothetical protein BST61_g10456 [Cercospora zeina]